MSWCKLRQPTGQRQSNVRTHQKKILIGLILFLYYEESLVSWNLNSKLLKSYFVRPNVHTSFSKVRFNFVGLTSFQIQIQEKEIRSTYSCFTNSKLVPLPWSSPPYPFSSFRLHKYRSFIVKASLVSAWANGNTRVFKIRPADSCTVALKLEIRIFLAPSYSKPYSSLSINSVVK